MKTIRLFPILVTLFCLVMPGVANAQKKQRKPAAQNAAADNKGLKDYYKDFFTMGVAVSPRSLESDETALILRHYASITAENAMKMGPIHPEEDRYYWEHADKIADFAQKHNLKLRGHVLCWHEQAPRWMFTDHKGDTVTKDVLMQRLKDHISTVVSRYKGRIYAWDVVNEAIADNPNEFLRNTPFYRICGEDFIVKAFEWAHEADPDAILYYNDYNTERPEKVERIHKLMKMLLDKGVPVHGLGLQGHWSVFEPSEKELRDALTRYSTLGVDLQITELDMSIYPWEKFNRERKPNESDALTPELEQKQIDQYRMAFQVFREFKDVITGVTFWNISDRTTWLDHYPVRGRKNYPLLFDQNLQPKKVYWAVVKF
jgi:endo-1,4-beta-xylanase